MIQKEEEEIVFKKMSLLNLVKEDVSNLNSSSSGSGSEYSEVILSLSKRYPQ